MKKLIAFIVAALVAVLAPSAHALAAVDSTTRVIVGDGPWGVVVSPDGSTTYVVNTVDRSVSFIDTASQSVVRTISISNVNSAYGVAITPDGSKIVVSSPADDTITTIQTTSPFTQTAYSVGASTPLQIAISSEGRYAYVTCNTSNVLAKIELTPSGYKGYAPTGISPVGIARKSGTDLYYVVNQTSNSVSVIDVASLNISETISLSVLDPYGIAFTPDGTKAFVSGSLSDQISIISSVTNSETSVFSTGDYPQGIAVSTDGTKMYVANSGSGTVEVFSTVTYSKIDTAVSEYTPTEIGVSPTNNSIWVSKLNDASTDNIFFSWPEPVSPELSATGFYNLQPFLGAVTILFIGLFLLRLRMKKHA